MLHEAPSKNYEIYKSDGSTPLSTVFYLHAAHAHSSLIFHG